jgi:hypothetical protein
MSDIYYNIYISSNIDGPWEKVNANPLADNQHGNSYRIENLVNGRLYYIMVIGGKYNEDNEFVEICTQTLRTTTDSGETGESPVVISAKPIYIV